MLASSERLGWHWSAPDIVTDDGRRTWEMLCDPPAAVAAAARRAVRRWRFGRIATAVPGLVPEASDAQLATDQGDTIVVDFAGTLGSLLTRRPAPVHSCGLWSAMHRGDLASAVSGGQWPQGEAGRRREMGP